jgi:hypothetical protein
VPQANTVLHQTVLLVLLENTNLVMSLTRIIAKIVHLGSFKTIPGNKVVKHAASDGFKTVPGPPLARAVQMANIIPLIYKNMNAGQV